MSATGLLVFSLGWAGGLVEAEIAGATESAILAVLGLLFLVLLIGIWIEFGDIDDERS